MRRIATKPVTFAVLALAGAGLASCGRFERAQRAAWRDQAEAQCLSSRQVQNSSYVSFKSSAIEGPGTCGMTQPLRVNAFSGGAVRLTSAATLACPIVPTTDRWLDNVVQKAAMERLGAQVIEVRAGSYSCRAMNNGSGTRRTSEHAYGNALDVFAFRTNDGREITVKNGWNGSPEEQAFLREVFLGACEMFSTVLGPGSDMFHYDHFHVDLARHGGGKRICKPRVDYTPNPNLMPPQPDRSGWSSARSQPAAGYGSSAMALAAPRAAEPYGAQASGWSRGPQGMPLTQPGQAATSGGPLMLPGTSYLRDEVVVGDLEGQGVLDRPGSDMTSSDPNADLITPENDPFAVGPPLRR